MLLNPGYGAKQHPWRVDSMSHAIWFRCVLLPPYAKERSVHKIQLIPPEAITNFMNGFLPERRVYCVDEHFSIYNVPVAYIEAKEER